MQCMLHYVWCLANTWAFGHAGACPVCSLLWRRPESWSWQKWWGTPQVIHGTPYRSAHSHGALSTSHSRDIKAMQPVIIIIRMHAQPAYVSTYAWQHMGHDPRLCWEWMPSCTYYSTLQLHTIAWNIFSAWIIPVSMHEQVTWAQLLSH